MFRVAVVALVAFGLVPVVAAQAADDDPWWRSGREALAQRLALRPVERRARNVILFVGDGMGISTVTAARIYDGQVRGNSGEENLLSFERFPYTALIKTYNTNAQVPDSAGTASAMMTGVKTNMGVINMRESHTRGICGDWGAGVAPSLTASVLASDRSAGLVTTTRLTHATPAAVYAHAPSRDWEDDTSMPQEAIRDGCPDIARQLVEGAAGRGLTVALGGGRSHFLPAAADGRREDGRDLTAEWLALSERAAHVTSAPELAALDLERTDRLLGLFAPSHMAYEIDRVREGHDEPSLADMTRAAVAILSRNPEGFFLMVEGGRIDHAHHAGNAFRALEDTRAFAAAIEAALELVDMQETLVLVTADHSHVLTMAGYPPRGNPILGLATRIGPRGQPTGEPLLAADGKPYTTLGYWSGPGAVEGERTHLTDDEARSPDHRQQAAIPLAVETHGGEDVALYAAGPFAHLVGGVLEQHVIYHLMAHAMGLATPPGAEADVSGRGETKSVVHAADGHNVSHNGTTGSDSQLVGYAASWRLSNAEPHAKGAGHEEGTIYWSGCPR